MLTLAEPGAGLGSRVELDGEPVPELLALAGVPAAEPPGFRWIRTSWSDWTRLETPGEATERWGVVARAFEAVATDPPPAWCPEWATIGMIRGGVTIARAESAFWRSVHEGKLRGPSGEVCLMQIHPRTAARLGVDLESLVGLDPASTERCIRVGVELLAVGIERCWGPGKLGRDWFQRAVVGYWTPATCTPSGEQVKGVELRGRLYARTGQRRPLTFRAMLAVEGT
jgi:hypothetical protein